MWVVVSLVRWLEVWMMGMVSVRTWAGGLRLLLFVLVRVVVRS